MLFPRDLRSLVIVPTLQRLDLYSPAAANLLLATAIAESVVGGWQHLAQVGGPALGLYQIEPATHRDVWENFLRFRNPLRGKVWGLSASGQRQGPLAVPQDGELIWNLAYATAIARIVYARDPEPLPPAHDLPALGAYWKRVFNTAGGKGTVEGFLDKVEPYRPFF